MTVKEFYQEMPVAAKYWLGPINQNLMADRWTVQTGMANILNSINTKIFYYNFNKELNPILEMFIEDNNITISTMTTTQLVTILRFLYGTYQEKWIKLWDNIYLKSYNSIWNVEGSDQTVHTFEHGKQVEETKNFTITMNKGSTDTETVTNNITDNDVYAFDSASPVGASKSTNNGSRTNVGSGFDSDVHTGTDTFKNTGVDTERTTLTRGMNLGIQSTQSLLEAELELRMKYEYFDIITADIIRELAINIY